jgi:hypothetical protein
MSFFKLDPEQARGFEPLPIGEYEAIVSNVEVTKAKSGNQMIKATLTIRDDVDQPGRKRKVFDMFVATDAAMFKFHQFGKAAGIEEVPTIEAYAKIMHGKAVRFKNKHETYNEKTSDKVAYYMPATVEYKGSVSYQDPFDSGATFNIANDDLPF